MAQPHAAMMVNGLLRTLAVASILALVPWVLRAQEEPVSPTLADTVISIDSVTVRSLAPSLGPITRLPTLELLSMQSATGGIQALLRTLPSVRGASDLSSQYSVRGGSFDENLVYIDGVEVLRPQLIRAGEQEGLSAINPDLVRDIRFSAGGFGSQYGDRISSVLDVKYRTPQEFRLAVEASLLESRAAIEGVADSLPLAYAAGVRYKSTLLLLASSEAKGDYRPHFFDAQVKLTYAPNNDWRISLVGIAGQNRYEFIPTVKSTLFGSLTDRYNRLTIFYEGQEQDRYTSYNAGGTAVYSPTAEFRLSIHAGYSHLNERESYDLLGEYWLSDLTQTQGSLPIVDSARNVAVGGHFEHARNQFSAHMVTLGMKGEHQVGPVTLEWGAQVQPRQMAHRRSEWSFIDSAGYLQGQTNLSVPYSLSAVDTLRIMPTSLYALARGSWTFDWGDVEFNAGARFSFVDRFVTPSVSPRANLQFRPSGAEGLELYVAGGLYHQYGFYHELMSPDGQLHPHLLPQQAAHALLGAVYAFKAGDIPFRLQVEGYYKWLNRMNPYTLRNLRPQYEARPIGVGYARGVEAQFHSQLTSGLQSWIALSFMQTAISIRGELDDPARMPRTDKPFPLPNDQLFSLSVYLRDYVPWIPGFQVALTAIYATGIPYSTPSGRYGDYARMESYKRVDIGFSYALKGHKSDGIPWLNRFGWLKSLQLGFEVINLLDFKNTASINWLRVPDSPGAPYYLAVPNRMLQRAFNIRLSASF